MVDDDVIAMACAYLDKEYVKVKTALISFDSITEKMRILLGSPRAVRTSGRSTGFTKTVHEFLTNTNSYAALVSSTDYFKGCRSKMSLAGAPLGEFLRVEVMGCTGLTEGANAETFKEWLDSGWGSERFVKHYPYPLTDTGSVRELLLHIKNYFSRILAEYGRFVDDALPRIQSYANDCLERMERAEAERDEAFLREFGVKTVTKHFKVDVVITEVRGETET